MAYASRSGRARTSSSNPQAFAVCNRCGIWYNRVDLSNQMRWRGTALLPTWIFVCARCYDIPNEQERVFVPPADPVPIILPFPEDFSVGVDVMGPTGAPRAIDPTTGLPAAPLTTVMATVDGIEMGPAPTGRPNGYYALGGVPNWQPDLTVFMCEADRATPMGTTAGDFMTLVPTTTGEAGPGSDVGWIGVQVGAPVRYGVPLPILSMMGDGTPLVRVTCSLPHGLALNAQIGVRGTKHPLADGVFSVIPITATVFTYGCYAPIPAGPLLEADTIVVTALVGLPREYAALPQTGGWDG
jgi:hypothetical protein